jgi:hypothetical protein
MIGWTFFFSNFQINVHVSPSSFIFVHFVLSMNRKQLTKHNMILAFQGWLMVPDATKWHKQYMNYGQN